MTSSGNSRPTTPPANRSGGSETPLQKSSSLFSISTVGRQPTTCPLQSIRLAVTFISPGRETLLKGICHVEPQKILCRPGRIEADLQNSWGYDEGGDHPSPRSRSGLRRLSREIRRFNPILGGSPGMASGHVYRAMPPEPPLPNGGRLLPPDGESA